MLRIEVFSRACISILRERKRIYFLLVEKEEETKKQDEEEEEEVEEEEEEELVADVDFAHYHSLLFVTHFVRVRS